MKQLPSYIILVIKVLRHATSLDVNNCYGLATLADMDVVYCNA